MKKENLTLFIFLMNLFICILFKIPVIYGVLNGAFIFFIYLKSLGFTYSKILKTLGYGLGKVKNIFFIFILIGCLTSLFRICGVLSYLVVKLTPLINVRYFYCFSFLISSLVSFVFGSSFASCGTIGFILVIISKSLMLNEYILGGAILSGIYFGDRMSPMSSSLILVSTLTDTKVYENIKNMIKTQILPFILAVIIYLLLGFLNESKPIDFQVINIFTENFNISILALIPVFLIIFLCLFKIGIKKLMAIAIFSSILLSVFLQGENLKNIFYMMIFGYFSENEKLGEIINGGGILSMIKPSLVVLVSSTYYGVFKETKILNGLKSKILKLNNKTNEFFTAFLVSTFTSIIAMNQTLSIILSDSLLKDVIKDNKKRALFIEDTAVILAPFVKWNIASFIPLYILNLDYKSIVYAFYLYLIIIFDLCVYNFKALKKYRI